MERDESSAQTILKRWSDHPLRRALNPVRVAIDPFRDAVRRIFPGKTTVPRENPKPTGCLRELLFASSERWCVSIFGRLAHGMSARTRGLKQNRDMAAIPRARVPASDL